MADTLAALVRKKYPGAYDDLSDQQLEAKVDAKYPGAYADVPRSAAQPPVQPSPDMGRYGAGKWSGQNYVDAANMGVDALPMIGGAVGGAAGAAGGAVFGLGVGGAPGAVGGAAFGGATGQALKTLIRNAEGRPIPETAAGRAGAIGTEAAIQGAAEGTGQLAGAGMKMAAPWLMKTAVKPTLSVLKEYGTTAPKLVKTLLDEGVNVSAGGLAKLQELMSKTNREIAAMVENAPGLIPKDRVIANTLPTAGRLAEQVNPASDLEAVAKTVQAFREHPVYTGDLTVREAQALKQGTYQQIGKKYGQVSSAEIETQKALARGLKEEVAAAAPGVAKLNAKDAEYMAAADATGRRVAVAENRDPVGFAWTASAHPATFIAALMDRHPVVKSMLANAMWKSAGAVTGVSPQLIRLAVHTLASEGSQPND